MNFPSIEKFKEEISRFDLAQILYMIEQNQEAIEMAMASNRMTPALKQRSEDIMEALFEIRDMKLKAHRVSAKDLTFYKLMALGDGSIEGFSKEDIKK